MARAGKVTAVFKDPLLDAYRVEAVVEGVPVRFIVTRLELTALTTRKAKRIFMRDKALEALDDRTSASVLPDLLGDFEL